MPYQYYLNISCPDQPGLIAATTGAVTAAGGNILDLRQHTAVDLNTFFLKALFALPKDIDDEEDRKLFELNFRADFAPLAEKLSMDWEPGVERLETPRCALGFENESLPLRTLDQAPRRRAGLRVPGDRLQPWRSRTDSRPIRCIVRDCRSVQGKSRVRGRAAGDSGSVFHRSSGARALYAGSFRGLHGPVEGTGDQYPPRISARIQRRETLPPGLVQGRQAHRRDGPLRQRGPGPGAPSSRRTCCGFPTRRPSPSLCALARISSERFCWTLCPFTCRARCS